MKTTRSFYSPKEDHLAIIYTDYFGYDRFKRFVAETEVIWLGPKLLTHQYVLKEHYLGPRTAQMHLSNVLTADRIPFDLDLKVFYRVDPRNVATENFIQALNMPDAGFESIVKTNTEEKVRNDIFISFKESELFDSHRRKYLRRELSSRISERVRGFGISVNPQFGVAVINMQPNAIYQRALQEESAASSQGNAVLKRLAPTMQILDVEEALQLFYTHLASSITKTDTIPSTIHTSEGIAQKLEKMPQNGHDGSKAKKRRGYKYPIAAD